MWSNGLTTGKIVLLAAVAMAASAKAQKLDFSLDFADHPWYGDAILCASSLSTKSPKNDLQWMLEFKHGRHHENPETITLLLGKFEDLEQTEQKREDIRKARSPFHPLRVWSYIFFLGNDGHGYFIPCSAVQPDMWTSEDEVEVSRKDFNRYRIDTVRSYWFDQIIGIIEESPDPQRTNEMCDLVSTTDDIKRFRNVFKTTKSGEDSENDDGSERESQESSDDIEDEDEGDHDEDEDGGEHDEVEDGGEHDEVEDGGEHNEVEGGEKQEQAFSAVRHTNTLLPGWKDDRLQVMCRENGRGAVINIMRRFGLGSSVLVPFYNWDLESEQFFDNTIRTPPLQLHPVSIGYQELLLPIWSLFSRRMYSKEPQIHLSTFAEPADGTHCLYCIDVLTTDERNIPGSHFLIPSECIDFASICEFVTKASGKTVESIRQYHMLGTALIRHEAFINLSDHLMQGLVLDDFLVRDGPEYYKALIDFADAHGDPGRKPVSWYGSTRKALSVEGNYLLTHEDLRTAMVNAVLHDGYALPEIKAHKAPKT